MNRILNFIWTFFSLRSSPSSSLPSYLNFQRNRDHTCRVQSSMSDNRTSSFSIPNAYRNGSILHYAKSNQYPCGSCLLVTYYTNVYTFNFELTEIQPILRAAKDPFLIMIADYHPTYTHALELFVYTDVLLSSTSSYSLIALPNVPCPLITSHSHVLYLMEFLEIPLLETMTTIEEVIRLQKPFSFAFYVYNIPFLLQSISLFINHQWIGMNFDPVTHIWKWHSTMESIWSTWREDSVWHLPIQLVDIRGNTLLDVLEFHRKGILDPFFHHGYWIQSTKSFVPSATQTEH